MIMDSLKTIFEKRNYEVILSLTEKAADAESLFYRASSFLAIGKPKEAMGIFERNRKALFSYNPLVTLKHNFEIRILLDEFDEAYQDLEEFRSYPYVSQSVEEKLSSLPTYLRKKEKESLRNKPLSIEEVKRLLSSPKSDYETLLALEAISRVTIDPFLPEIKSLLISSAHPSVKTYAFLLLINCKYDESVTLKQGDVVYQLIPKNVEPPFVNKRFKDFKNKLEALAKDPSVAGVGFSLFSDYTLAVFPSSPFSCNNDDLLLLSFYSLALSYLRNDDVSLIDNPYHIPSLEIEKKKKEISSVLSSIPPLTE